MADISKIKLPNGSEYNIKDSAAREAIETFPGMAASFVGTALVIENVNTLEDAEEETF